jgi:hypothetical protein
MNLLEIYAALPDELGATNGELEALLMKHANLRPGDGVGLSSLRAQYEAANMIGYVGGQWRKTTSTPVDPANTFPERFEPWWDREAPVNPARAEFVLETTKLIDGRLRELGLLTEAIVSESTLR